MPITTNDCGNVIASPSLDKCKKHAAKEGNLSSYAHLYDVADEALKRSNADDAERTARKEADDLERAARIAADLAEAKMRQEADNALDAKISDEATTREREDEALYNDILEEIGIRETDVAGLTTRVEALEEDVSDIDSALTAEATARIAADDDLSNRLASETTARTAADGDLSTRLDAEESTRATADNDLDAKIAAETAARTAADTTLNTRISAEEAGRIGVDEDLDAKITAEATARANADTTLSAKDADLEAAIEELHEGLDSTDAALDTKRDKVTGNTTGNTAVYTQTAAGVETFHTLTDTITDAATIPVASAVYNYAQPKGDYALSSDLPELPLAIENGGTGGTLPYTTETLGTDAIFVMHDAPNDRMDAAPMTSLTNYLDTRYATPASVTAASNAAAAAQTTATSAQTTAAAAQTAAAAAQATADGKEDAFSVLPVSKGGTGASSVIGYSAFSDTTTIAIYSADEGFHFYGVCHNLYTYIKDKLISDGYISSTGISDINVVDTIS